MNLAPDSRHSSSLEVGKERRTLLSHRLEQTLVSRTTDVKRFTALLLGTLYRCSSLLVTNRTPLRREKGATEGISALSPQRDEQRIKRGRPATHHLLPLLHTLIHSLDRFQFGVVAEGDSRDVAGAENVSPLSLVGRLFEGSDGSTT